jgi:integrase
MASIRTRSRKDGSEYHTLTWREEGTQRALSFDTLREAENWKRLLDANGQSLTKAEQVYDEGLIDGPTLAEMFDTHIEQLTGVGTYMIKRYKRDVENHFGALSSRPVVALKHEDIVHWIKDMQKKSWQGKPMSPKTIANKHGLLSATMSTAVRMGYRTDNPCKGVKLPKNTNTEDTIRFIEKGTWNRIMENMDPHFVPFFQLLVGTGLRFGEATALTAKDFDLDGPTPTVRVTKAWKSDDSGGYFVGPPKTRRSVRTVSLAPSTVAAIRPAIAAAGDGYIFTLKRGGVMRSGSTYNRAWEPALKAAGIPKEDRPRIHDTRHTHASWMIAAGMEIFALSRRLGHESVTTTMDRYSHILPDALFIGANIAQKALEA